MIEKLLKKNTAGAQKYCRHKGRPLKERGRSQVIFPSKPSSAPLVEGYWPAAPFSRGAA